MISFKYEGEPVGKGRPRLSKWGTYTPQRTVEFERAVRQAYLATGQAGYNDGEELCVEMVFNFSVPKSYSRKRRNSCLCGHIGHTKKPDVDNVIKSVLDAISGEKDGQLGAMGDDSQVVAISAYKRYAEEPSVEVRIWEKKRC